MGLRGRKVDGTQNRERARKLFAAGGITPGQIASRLSCSVNTVYTWIKDLHPVADTETTFARGEPAPSPSLHPWRNPREE